MKKEKITLNAFLEKLQNIFTPKCMAVLLTAVYAVSLIPLLWIGLYNYPSADDYSIGSNAHRAFVETGNLFAVLWAGIVRAVEDWVTWMGYFTSNFLMAVPPSSFGERWYVLTPFLMLGILTFGTVYLLKCIFVKVFRGDKYVSHCVSMLMLFVTVQCMVGRVEAFYWYSGAANYMFVHGMCMFFYGMLISILYATGKKKTGLVIGASVLGFFVGGGNQMTALNAAIVVLVAAGFLTVLKKWKVNKALAFPMGFLLLGFVLNVAAPGNWVRAEISSGMNPIKAVLVSFYYGMEYCISEWSGWPVLLLMIALIPLFWQMAERTEFSFPYPIVIVLFGYCLVSAMMTPPLFAVGNTEAARLKAVTFAVYILVLTLCIGYVVGWARKKIEKMGLSGAPVPKNECASVEESAPEQETAAAETKFGTNGLLCLLTCLLVFALASGITVIPDNHYFTWSSAVTDLANGSAKAYGDARKARLAIYESGEMDVEVEKLPAEPKLIYFSDIKPDPKDWENGGLCRYYGINSVRVKE